MALDITHDGGFLVDEDFRKELFKLTSNQGTFFTKTIQMSPIKFSGTWSPGYDYSECGDILVELQNLVKDSIRSDADVLRIQFLFDLLFGKRKEN